MLPYRQGDLDSLCGLYAILNAVRWADRHHNRLNRADHKALFDRLIEVSDQGDTLTAIVRHGTTIPEMSRLLHVAADDVSRHHGLHLTISKPFHRYREAPARIVLAAIARHTRDHANGVIAMTRHADAHWTLITAITPKRLELFDSTSRQWLRSEQCRFAASAQQQTRLLPPAGLFFVALSQAQSRIVE